MLILKNIIRAYPRRVYHGHHHSVLFPFYIQLIVKSGSGEDFTFAP
jgi:hypothetical protein